MSESYRPEEIYQIAIDIEKNGKSFYEGAADAESAPEMKKFFTDLALWETSHVQIFQQIKETLCLESEEESVADPQGPYAKYFADIASRHVFVMSDSVLKLIAKCNTPLDILQMALQFEKDSVVLYIAMKKLVPRDQGREKIEDIINEEIQHVSFITEKIKGFEEGEHA